MQLVIADTGPINYLILIDHVDILPALFERVVLPSAVRDELARSKAPPVVQKWIAEPPSWVDVRPVVQVHDPALDKLDAGEEDAIALAIELHADLPMMDDREGVIVARRKGFRVAGTLTVLAMAAHHQLLNLADAFDRIKLTNFHYQQELIDQFLREISDQA